ncbi:MAG: lysine--tRNA ligase [Planctomycetota bacterium]
MSEERIRAVKLEKITRLREQGVSPYPERFARTHTLAEASRLDEGTEGVRAAGRIISRREFGKLTFFDLMDIEGRLQVSLQQDEIGRESFRSFAKLVDIGDFVGVVGEIYRTRVGQITVKAGAWQLLGKTLHPLPEKYHAIADGELRTRRRYLDLIMDGESRRRFLLRGRLVRSLRSHLDESGFHEVDTPVLCTSPSGALATPFVTHHNALDMPLYLSIAPETYLKRCIVAGYDRVYEFARVFRNEGIDPSHLQDFTMLEYYVAYWNYIDNMSFTEELIRRTLAECLGSLRIEAGEESIDLGEDWARRAFGELIDEHAGIDIDKHPDAESLRAAIASRGIPLEGSGRGEIDKLGRGSLVDLLYKKMCRPKLRQPTFVTDHPIELSPLARRRDGDAAIADRFQLVVRGWEILNAYSELVDPIDQRRRLEEQARLRAAGDEEAMPMDHDYLLAMEHGMPPISGWGMGIDRFAALACGVENLRDVVLFPLMRPEEGMAAEESAHRPPGERAP